MVRRLTSFALVAVACAGGCAASRVGHVPPKAALAEKATPSRDIGQIVDRHNQNAELVTSLEASPSVTARRGGGGRGNMVFERDHNFRFVVEGGMSGKHYADMGSNDEEFWFWADDKQDRHVYVSRYDAMTKPGGTELAFQPDWIIEALGLRVIPDDEVRQIRVVNNDAKKPGTDLWYHSRKTLRGEPVDKVTLVSRNTGEVLEHRFYAPGIKTPVATATPLSTTEATLADNAGARVQLPKQIHLRLDPADAKQSPMEMDLVLSGVKVNAPIEHARRDELFAVPQIAGSPIKRLDEPSERAELGGAATTGRGAGRTETRQSSPAPPAGEGVRLGAPSPIGVDGAYLRRSDAMPFASPDLGGDGGAVLGVPVPTAPENPAERLSRRDPIH
ncbi:MAG: hypothetical protein JWN86_2619 [Planctomycetota bacterium]|nr:hypothetical protein [Planctomycetota bacterium]